MSRMIDSLTIKPLSSELADDYFDFFDNRAFTNHEEWSCCYCTYFHFDKEREKEVGEIVKAGADLKSTLRSVAAKLIKEGTRQTVAEMLLMFGGVRETGFLKRS